MAGEGDRERRSDDPFEDLDSFFEPIEGVQWPDEVEEQAPQRVRVSPPIARAAGRDPETAPIGGAAAREPEAAPVEPEPHAARDAEPMRSEPDRPVPDLIELEPRASRERAEPAFDPWGSGAETAAEPQPTREMTSEEWRRLRDVLGEDAVQSLELPAQEPPSLIRLDEEEDFDLDRGFAAVPEERERVRVSASAGSGTGRGSTDEPGSGEGAAGRPEPPHTERAEARGESRGAEPAPAAPPSAPAAPPAASEEDDLTAAWPEPELDDEPGGLTLDDLRKAPPEYVDLPGPRDPERAERVQPPPPAASSRPTVPGGGHVQVVGATGGPPEPPPSLAEVEAMAESLAREFRSSPDEGIEVLADVERPSGEVGSSVGAPGGADRGAAASRPTERPEMPPFDDMLGEFEAPEPPTPAPRSTPRTVKVGAPEDLMGPSWEDPTARTVTRERSPAPRRPGDRDLPVAVTTGAALVALALLALAIKPFAFAVVVALVIMIGQAEFYAATQRQGYHPATLLGLVAGAMIVAGAYYRGESGILLMVILAVVATFLWFMATPVRLRTDVIANAGVTIFGLLYIPVIGSFYVVLLTATGSRALVIAVLGLTFLYDVAAFFIGRYWGRRPLASTISPKKSWEGLVGATFVTVLVASVLPRSFGPLTSELKLFGLGVVIVLMAPLGDLVESMLKRDLGIKDMGSILPGHGGMLDRVDSALLVAPAVYYFLRLVS